MLASRLGAIQKVSILATAPMAAFFFLSVQGISSSYERYAEASRLADRMSWVGASSFVIHELQRERGLSAIYLNDDRVLEEMRIQRRRFELAWNSLALSETAEHSELLQVSERLSKIRGQIDYHLISSETAILDLSSLIQIILEEQSRISNASHHARLAAKTRALIVLQASKEKAGRLRAYVSSILSADGAITREKLEAITLLWASVETQLATGALVFDPITETRISSFKVLPEWKETGRILLRVIESSRSGRYGISAKKYFDQITAAIDHLSVTIQMMVKSTEAEAIAVRETAKHELVRNIAMLTFLTLVLAVLLGYGIPGTLAPIARQVRIALGASDEAFQKAEVLLSASGGYRATLSNVKQISEKASKDLQAAVLNAESILRATEAHFHQIRDRAQELSSEAHFADILRPRDTGNDSDSFFELIRLCQKSLESISQAAEGLLDGPGATLELLQNLTRQIHATQTLYSTLISQAAEGDRSSSELMDHSSFLAEKLSSIHQALTEANRAFQGAGETA